MTHSFSSGRQRLFSMVLLSMFTAILFLLTFTPLGLIDLPIMKATILHIPVILGSLLLGSKKGAFLGGMFGLCSFLKNTLMPNISSFVFTPFFPLPGSSNGNLLSLIVCFVPRILTGIIPWFIYQSMNKIFAKVKGQPNAISAALAALAGSFTNTILVMGLIALLFSQPYSTAHNIPAAGFIGFLTTIVIANGVPEAIAAAILVPVLYLPLCKILKQQGFV